jgi:hypothetical protein
MLKKLMLATIASLVLVSGLATAAAPMKQRFMLDISVLDISASVETDPYLDSENIKNTDKQKRITFQACTRMCEKFILGEFWQTANYDVSGKNGTDCFPVGPVFGAVHISQTKSGESKVQLWFDSTYGPSETEVRYLLVLTGTPWSENFPPLLNEFSSMLATDWEMGTEGKGRYRNDSCKGSGSFVGDEQPLLEVGQIALLAPE